jgi:hypothetical protein
MQEARWSERHAAAAAAAAAAGDLRNKLEQASMNNMGF